MSINNSILLSLIMMAAGIGIPIFAALNSGLGSRLENPNFAALILFAIGLIITGVISISSGLPSREILGQVPIHYYFGGVFVITYVITMTWIGPKLGIGNAVFLVLLGQLVAAAIIDHFALMGAPHAPITIKRALGILLMAIGVFLARRPDIS